MTPRWDERQRAMLGALGLNWWPGAAGKPGRAAPAPAPVPAVAAPAIAPVSAPPAPVVAPAPARAVPVAELLHTLREPAPPQAPAVSDVAGLDWPALEERIRGCQACVLCQKRRQAVPGVGLQTADWLIVGEGPGEQEDLQGEPFVGPSGQLLDAMLAALRLSRQPGAPAGQVYIANAVKCRPPGNRNPEPDEIAACRPYLLRQIELIRPRVILALGRIAVQSLLGSEAPLGKLRGQVHRGPLDLPVVVSYHPAYLLRNPLEKARAWEDLCLAADTLEAAP
ncbi:MAG: uracil-DNA glycosylase [Inhella sp.]